MKAYIVNMETSKARRNAITRQLKKLKIPYEIVPAVDGRKYTDAQMEDLVFDVKEFTGAQMGCMSSHRKVYERMQESEEEFGLVLEDDCLINDPDFGSLVAQAAGKLKDNHIGLLTYYWCRENNLELTADPTRKIKTPQAQYIFCKPHDIHGVGRAGAYILSKKTSARMLQFHTPVLSCHADSWIVYFEKGIISGVDCLYPMPVSENPEFGSEIGYTRSSAELLAKKVAEQAVKWNIPFVADAIRRKRLNFSKRYKNIVVK